MHENMLAARKTVQMSADRLDKGSRSDLFSSRRLAATFLRILLRGISMFHTSLMRLTPLIVQPNYKCKNGLMR